jgi:hypothetical protein
MKGGTMSYVQMGPDWWQASDGLWYEPELHPDFRVSEFEPSVADLVSPPDPVEQAPDRRRRLGMPLNELRAVTYRGGWIGLFAGESQLKALQRALPQINAAGYRVVAAVEDRWSFWKRLGVVLLLIVTLGFVGKVPNVLLVTEPMG